MTPEVVYTFYAADLLGATLNLVDPRSSAEGIREYIEEVASRMLICLNVVYPRCPVSYTHLDVYKRQTSSLPPFRLFPGGQPSYCCNCARVA